MPDTRTSNQDGDEVVFFATHANTGAATLDVDGIGALAIVNHEGNALIANDILNGIAYVIRYDATNTRYQLASPSAAYQTSTAASAAAAAVSETNAAASAVIAGQWAVHPEDDDVDSAPGQFSAFHWAQKALGAASTSRIIADITTATPPTTEAVTAQVQYWDADETDQLAYLGYNGDNIFRMQSLMHGAQLVLQGEDAAGALRNILSGDPDAQTTVYHAGTAKLTTTNTGILLPFDNTPATPSLAFGDGDTGLYESANDVLEFAVAGVNLFSMQAGWIVRSTGSAKPGLLDENATGTNANIIPVRADTDTGIGSGGPDTLAIVCGAVQVANFTENVGVVQMILPQANTPATPQFAFGDGDTGFFEQSNDQVRFSAGGVARWATFDNYTYSTVASGFALKHAAATSTSPALTFRSDDDTGLGWAGANLLSLIAGSKEVMRIQASGPGVMGDILTADPPTSEAITANLEYYDSDGSTEIAQVGFAGTNDYLIVNRMEGGNVNIRAQNSSSVQRTMIQCDPDAGVILNHAGTTRFATDAAGSVTVRGTLGNDPAIGGVQDAQYNLANSAGVEVGDLTFLSGTTMLMRNLVHGGTITLQGQDTGGTNRAVFNGDPDGAARLYHAGALRIGTASGGVTELRSDGSTDTESRYVTFSHADSVNRARVGHIGSATFYVRNMIHGGRFIFDAEDNAGVVREILNADPDAVTTLRGDTDLTLQVAAGEDAILATANGSVAVYYDGNKRMTTEDFGLVNVYSVGNTDTEFRGLNFAHQDGTSRAFLEHTVTGSLQLQNSIHGAPVHIGAEDAGGNLRRSFDADPDSQTIIRGDTNIVLMVAMTGETTAENALVATANGSVALYHNAIEKFRTVSETAADRISGAQVLDAEGNYQSVGLGVAINDTTTFDTAATHTPFQQVNAGQIIYYAGTGAANWDTYASTGSNQTDIPAGTEWTVQMNGTGSLTIRGGTTVTIRYWTGSGAPADVDVTISRGAWATVRKVSDSIYDVVGLGTS
jgi:hypothetical protein